MAEGVGLSSTLAPRRPRLTGIEEHARRQVGRIEGDTQAIAHQCIELGVGQRPATFAFNPVLTNPVIFERVVGKVTREAAANARRDAALAQQAAQHQCKVAAGAGRSPLRRQAGPLVRVEQRQALSNRQGFAAERGVLHAVSGSPVRMDQDALDKGAHRQQIERHDGELVRNRPGSERAPWVR